MSFSDLQWLRPMWLWGFIPLIAFILYWLTKRSAGSVWDSVVDPQLRPYVIEGEATRSDRSPLLLFAAWALALVMLAGPVWEQQDVPVFQAQQAEVVLLDLSGSMLADDLAPSRLARARFKLSDLLAQSEGMQIGLIGFTERPYVISPLTEDTNTIQAFLPSLTPDIMPVQGSRLDLAIERAVQLLNQAGVQQGHILYIGDQQVIERDLTAATNAAEQGHRLSVLAVGTSAGKPLRNDAGQFVRDAGGAIVVPQLSMSSLQALANNGGGQAVRLTPDSSDLDRLATVRDNLAIEAGDHEEATSKAYWVEYSPWFVWLLMALALLLFRRGVIA